MSNKKGTIWSSNDTKMDLRLCKIHERETDEDVIIRLINFYKENNPKKENKN